MLCTACRRIYSQGDGAADSKEDGGGNGKGGGNGEKTEKKQALANLSSAKLALQGVLSKTKVSCVLVYSVIILGCVAKSEVVCLADYDHVLGVWLARFIPDQSPIPCAEHTAKSWQLLPW